MEEPKNGKPLGQIIGVAAAVGFVVAIAAHTVQYFFMKEVSPAMTGGAAAGAAAVVAATWGRKKS